jgi:hypothetical protein
MSTLSTTKRVAALHETPFPPPCSERPLERTVDHLPDAKAYSTRDGGRSGDTTSAAITKFDPSVGTIVFVPMMAGG